MLASTMKPEHEAEPVPTCFCLETVNDVIDDKNVVTNIMSKSTGLQHIGCDGFAIRHWQTGYYPVAGGLCLGLC